MHLGQCASMIDRIFFRTFFFFFKFLPWSLTQEKKNCPEFLKVCCIMRWKTVCTYVDTLNFHSDTDVGSVCIQNNCRIASGWEGTGALVNLETSEDGLGLLGPGEGLECGGEPGQELLDIKGKMDIWFPCFPPQENKLKLGPELWPGPLRFRNGHAAANQETAVGPTVPSFSQGCFFSSSTGCTRHTGSISQCLDKAVGLKAVLFLSSLKTTPKHSLVDVEKKYIQ